MGTGSWYSVPRYAAGSYVLMKKTRSRATFLEPELVVLCIMMA